MMMSCPSENALPSLPNRLGLASKVMSEVVGGHWRSHHVRPRLIVLRSVAFNDCDSVKVLDTTSRKAAVSFREGFAAPHPSASE
jgi:hypothetical protein